MPFLPKKYVGYMRPLRNTEVPMVVQSPWYIYIYIHTYVRANIGMLWSNGLQIDHTVTYSDKSSAVLHTMWVMLRMCLRIEQLWATLCTGLTASASPFLLLLPLSNTLVDFRPLLRSEVIHAKIQLCVWMNEKKRVMRVQQYTQIAVYVHAYAFVCVCVFVWKLTSFSCFVCAASRLTSSLSSLRIAWVQVWLQNCSLHSNSAESSVLAPSSASPRWSVRRFPPPPPSPSLSFVSSALCH